MSDALLSKLFTRSARLQIVRLLPGLPILKMGSLLSNAASQKFVRKQLRTVAEVKERTCCPVAKTVIGCPERACWTKVGITKPPAWLWREPATLNGRITNAFKPRHRLLIVIASIRVLPIAYSMRALYWVGIRMSSFSPRRPLRP